MSLINHDYMILCCICNRTIIPNTDFYCTVCEDKYIDGLNTFDQVNRTKLIEYYELHRNLTKEQTA
jgi:hypothetical protein